MFFLSFLVDREDIFLSSICQHRRLAVSLKHKAWLNLSMRHHHQIASLPGQTCNSEVTLVWAEAAANRLAALSTQTLFVRGGRFYFTWTVPKSDKREGSGVQKKAGGGFKHMEKSEGGKVRQDRKT